MTLWSSYYVVFVCCVIIQICFVYGQKSSLTFVIDDSGSMTDEIEQVKSSVESIFDTVMMSNTSQIENFVLVTFNDPDFIIHTVTTDKAEFKAAASKLHVRGGNPSCPELAMTGIREAIKESLPLSTLYVFTDAAAKDADQYETVKAMAMKKQIQITFMLTGDCGSRENDRYQVYHHLANDTSGEVFNLMKSDITDLLEYVKENTKSRSDIIASKTFEPGYGNKLEYSVDSKMKELMISVTGLRPKIEVTDSEGNKVPMKHILNKDEIAIVKATDLKPGVYIAEVGSQSKTYVKVMGQTSVNFYYGFSEFETKSLNETATRPNSGGDAYLSIKLQGEGVTLKSVKVFDMADNMLEELPLRLIDEKERYYVTKSFHPPTVAFTLSVIGYVEDDKTTIKRRSQTPILRRDEKHEIPVNESPSTTITGGPKIFVDYASPLQVKCNVHGYPKPNITWQEKDSGVILPSTVRTIEEPNIFMSILHIEKPNKNVTYECRAHNDLGTNISSVEVATNVYFNVVEKPPDTTEVDYGKEGNIRCSIDASPKTSIAWYHNGTLLTNDSNVIISSDMSTVTIKHVTFDSQGTYTCDVGNEYSNKSFSSVLVVTGLEKPFIEKPAEKTHVTNASDALLTCRILRGTPKPTVQWSFRQPMTTKFTQLSQTGETLQLKSVSVDDFGTYMCNATNVAGSQSYTMDLIVEYSPTITKDGEEKIEIKKGSDVTLSCHVDGVPIPTVQWLRNGIVVYSSKNVLVAPDHSLKITSVDISDTGQYTCEAENKLGRSKKTVYIDVFEKPLLELAEKKIRITEGKDVELKCGILRGTPKPTMKWSFRHPMAKKFTELSQTGETLLLTSVSVDKVGTYMCNATNVAGSQTYTMDLIVEYSPLITKDGEEKVEINKGSDVTLSCHVDGVPIPTVQWLRNGIAIHSSKNILVAADHTLIFTSVDISDTGQYTCEAKNKIGCSIKTVFIDVFETPVFADAEKEISITKGKDVELKCRILRGTPKPTIKWSFRQPMAMNFTELSQTGEALLLKSVSDDKVGTYMCNATNVAGSQTYSMDLIVEYSPTITKDGEENIEIKKGSDVTLSCHVDGVPIPTVQWLRNGIVVHSSKTNLVAADHSLRMTSVDISDTGQYTCEAENKLGRSKKTVFIDVFETPVFEDAEKEISITKGKDVELNCRILRGTPKPIIKWSFRQPMAKKFTELSQTGETLLLKSVSVDKVGTYMCNATNEAGSQTYTMDLTVEYSPTITKDGEEKIEIKKGSDVTLSCRVDGVPIPTVRWLRNGIALHSSKTMSVAADHSLKITSVEISDTGQYTCEAENKLGRSKKTVYIDVFETPVFENAEKETRITKGKDVELKCRILRGTPKPTIKWSFREPMAKKFTELSQTGETLPLKSVSVDKVGTYMCNATNVAGSQTYTMDLIVEYSPKITKDAEEKIEIKKGSDVTLSCNVDGVPIPTVQWLRNGIALHSSKTILVAADHSLKITSVEVSDTGQYTCEAENKLGRSKKTVFIEVFETPVFKNSEKEMRITKGKDVELRCHILRGTPRPTIKWSFREPMAKKFTELSQTGETLPLRSVSVDKVGTYMCNATNVAGSQTYTMDLIVEYSPTITKDGEENIEIKKGSDVTLSCHVDGVPIPTVQWLRNGITIHSSKNILVAADHSLRITSVDISDTGQYTCEAENKLGRSKKTVYIDVFEKPIFVNAEKEMRVTKAKDFEMKCRILRGTPKPTIKWSFRQPMAKKFTELSQTGETLLLKSVSVDKVGTYMCNATNVAGSQTYTMDLIVEYSPTVRKDGEDKIEIKKGSDVTLSCHVDGVPIPTVQWLRNGIRLHNSKNIFVAADHSLKITSVDISDTGQYDCEAANKIGRSKKTVFINVFETPVFEDAEKETRITKGKDVELKCHILRGTPKPTIQWSFRQLMAKKFTQLSQTGETLLLKSVSVDKVGTYMCNATNVAGSQTYTMDLIVEYSPTITKDGEGKIEIKKGREVTLSCNVDGVPIPTVQWLRNGIALHSSKNILVAADHTLKIISVEISDTGHYTCEAANKIGHSRKTVFIDVFETPVFENAKKETRITKGKDVELKCHILRGTPKPTIQWSFRQPLAKKFTQLSQTGETLLLKSVSVDKVGTYICNATNVAGSQTYTMDLIVEYSPTITKDGEGKIEIKKGREVTLSCHVDGVPIPTVQWLRNGIALHSSKNILVAADHSLKIISVEISDTGHYTCEAANKIGHSRKTVFIDVFETPVFENAEKEIRITKGKDVELKCRILRGTPKPTIKWSFRQPMAKKFTELSQTGETLPLKSVSGDKVGTYMCNATNVAGSQTYTMDLIVEYSPTITKDGEENIEIKKGSDVTLSCHVDGVPIPSVQWLRNGIVVYSSKNILVAPDHSLRLTSVEISDTGQYTCEARNKLGRSKKTVYIDVFEKPVLQEPKKEISITKGKDVELNCRILRGTPKPTIQWSFRQPMAKKFTQLSQTGETLLLKSVSVDKVGTYMCNATNVAGSQTYTMDLIVEYAATIKGNRIKKMLIKKGEEVNLPCVIDGVPEPRVIWLRNDTTLDVSTTKNIFMNADQSLKITAIEVLNTGSYTCEAENYLGSATKVFIIVVYIPVTIDGPKYKSKSILVGQNVILSCHAHGYPEPEINWLFKRFDSKAAPKMIRAKYGVRELSIDRVQLKNQGSYTCVASNIGGSSNITYELQVLAAPVIDNLYADRTFKTVRGDLVLKIKCKALGSPKPTIVWKKDYFEDDSGSKLFSVKDGTLILRNIEKKHQGPYTCYASNDLGNTSIVYKVIVQDYPAVPAIKSPPIFIIPGKRLDVPCDVPHDDTDHIRWYKDSRLIAHSKLILNDVTDRDIGVYSCRVSTRRKSYSAHVELKMGHKPQFITKELELQKFNRGDYYRLVCSAEGKPEPQTAWTFNGKTLSEANMIYTIDYMDYNNRGTYTCVVSNIYGSITRSIRIAPQDCLLNLKTDLQHDKQPMMLTTDMRWPLFRIDDGFMIVEQHDVFYFHCPDGSFQFKSNYVRATCVGETQITLHGKGQVRDYSEVQCKKDIKPITKKTKILCLFRNSVYVEVGYQIFHNFLTVYSVCLDKRNKNTLFTRHTLSPEQYGVSNYNNRWWSTNLLPPYIDMLYNCKNQVDFISSILGRPYSNDKNCCFGKRQLVSPMDLKPGIPTSTVYTYLNVVPHWSTCNAKNWEDMETKVRNLAKILKTALTIYTGTKTKDGKPQYLWKVVQDPVRSSSLAIIQINVPDLSPRDALSLVLCTDICDEIDWMEGTNWHDVANGYIFCCSILDFESTFRFTGKFNDGSISVLKIKSDTPDDYADY